MAPDAEPDISKRDDPAVSAVLAAVARLAEGRGRVDTAYQHNPTARFTIAPHAHADLLQLDLIDGCAGRCHTGGAWRGIAGLTALLSRPGETHGYDLHPTPGAAAVHHVKLRIDDTAGWPLFDGGHLRPCAPRIDAARDLLTPFRRLTRGGGAPPDAAEEVALLAEILALWPRLGAPHAAAPRDRGEANLEALDPRLTPALRLLHAPPLPMAPPPSLSELANACHLSTRHFSRRFAERIGCTPHAYADARRLAAARDLLRDPALRVFEVGDKLGFSGPAAFTRWFSESAGMPPKRFREDPGSL
ncbi:helix-turn-helix domain-containing protein [Phycisphaera mikurensis]|uniref:Putative AraC family transcriptional regulator n=1 Tax=Phycisphaera mikurensis (strain NBRC 102666 / KCTC 22515 / FYK2301M01) TaxID=1142394 RepID=I0ICM8_PHYMF|nr:helix-turn-helix domain-containing protein [Phycisphaera mikurensis]MBB6442109.1 AraC-like DNA-binding protein [Phycisphaera mikurensis]BAM03016.1 putative AraC family transcriptional regulator [Phycisphaera mikurensis NBRC 102666]